MLELLICLFVIYAPIGGSFLSILENDEKLFFRWHVVYLLFVVIHCYLWNPVLYILCCLIVLLCDICEATSQTFMIIY